MGEFVKPASIKVHNLKAKYSIPRSNRKTSLPEEGIHRLLFREQGPLKDL